MFRPKDCINPRQDALWAAVSERNFAAVLKILGPSSIVSNIPNPEGSGGCEPANPPKYDDVNFIAPDGWAGVPGKGGRSLMHHAAWIGDADIFALLLSHGGEVGEPRKPNWARGKGFTAFHHACFYNRPVIAEMCLVNAKADVNAIGEDGFTPLHLAAKFGYLPLTELLLRHGACLTSLNKGGKRPVDLASKDEIKEVLLRAEATTASGGGCCQGSGVAVANLAAASSSTPGQAFRQIPTNGTSFRDTAASRNVQMPTATEPPAPSPVSASTRRISVGRPAGGPMSTRPW